MYGEMTEVLHCVCECRVNDRVMDDVCECRKMTDMTDDVCK